MFVHRHKNTHIKLCDFGLARVVDENGYIENEWCGTIEFQGKNKTKKNSICY